MKCRLVQILAVAVLLGHTVLNFNFNRVNSLFESRVIDEQYISGVTSITKSAASEEVKLDKLHTKVDSVIEKLTLYNFAQFDGTNKKQAYNMIDKVFKIRKYVLKSTHKDKDKLLKKMDTEINALVKKLRIAMKNPNEYINQMEKYCKRIAEELIKIRSTHSLRDVNIQWISDRCNEAGIKFLNINEHLQPEQMKKKLLELEKVLDTKARDKYKILHRMYKLLKYINGNNYIRIINRDTRDTQSMRNVIGISIAVCAIVTLCIVLLIAVRNKHRANTGVRLVNWV